MLELHWGGSATNRATPSTFSCVFRIISGMFQGFFKVVKGGFRDCFIGVSVLFHGCFCWAVVVLRRLLWYYRVGI